jgi:hypothetical protein
MNIDAAYEMLKAFQIEDMTEYFDEKIGIL